jgi:hypothetical protein
MTTKSNWDGFWEAVSAFFELLGAIAEGMSD